MQIYSEKYRCSKECVFIYKSLRNKDMIKNIQTILFLLCISDNLSADACSELAMSSTFLYFDICLTHQAGNDPGRKQYNILVMNRECPKSL